jgi:hypothetical protein
MASQQNPQDLQMMSFFSRSAQTVRYRGVEVPERFVVVVDHPVWPTKVEFIVVVDPDAGPALAGVEATDGQVTLQAATTAITDTVGVETVLAAATAWVAGELAALRALGVDVDLTVLTNQQRAEYFAVRDSTWSHAFALVRKRRRVLSRELLRQVAEVYRKAYAAGDPPTKAVAEHFTVSHRTATRWVSEARRVGEMGPAQGTRAGEATDEQGGTE